jgi:NAD(P)-dependent dehydrogenase (short-subunit alcohol dehydrogenase family)
MRFAQKVIVVAGGTGGLGRAVSQAFLAEGATVVVTYRSESELDDLTRTVPAAGARLTGLKVDVTDEQASLQLVGSVVTQYSRIDALFNSVGGYAGGVKLWDTETKVLDRLFNLNLRSGFALTRAVTPVMLRQRSGCIVNVAAKAAFDHPAGAAAYAASKAAAVALIDSLAAELVGSGVRVNSVIPSVIDTEANRKAMPKADFARWPKPEDIAQVVLFLCSPEGKAIHGAAIPVDGFG